MKPKTHYVGKIPFDEDGSMKPYVATYSNGTCDKTIWKDNFVFTAVMKIDGYGRGRSSATFDLLDMKTNLRYSVFMQEMFAILQNCHIESGIITKDGDYACDWTFCKRGTNFSLKLVAI